MKKILIITPRFPVPTSGACEQDRAEGMKQLKRLGNEIQVIGKVFDFQNKENIEKFSRENYIPVHLVPYRYTQKKSLWRNFLYHLRRFIWPPYWDGSVYEYADPAIKNKLTEVLENWRPDIVWFDYTFMLPLYPIARRFGCKIITHSLVYDPNNLLEEEGGGLLNHFRAKIKTVTERASVKNSDYVFAITPDEEKLYRKLGAKNIQTLPLRALYNFLGENEVAVDKKILNVFFMGSSYNIKHNLQAVKFIIEEVVPLANKKYPDKFKFFITGGKMPEDLRKKCVNNINYLGFVDDIGGFLRDMDIALVPSLFGAGMQQKIFEPLARGFPVIISQRGLVGYDFECGREVLCASNAEEFTARLGQLLDFNFRKKISSQAAIKSRNSFSREKSDAIILKAI
ncbi:MAG: hypothetical protein A2373_00285 [Candidatus Magasanikbacteria bacterium RIFOXYB1_FULL_40_15]|uniref:Glycosyltransferase subfamily 4-like N-terminal domain-containing protein n=2 Tax=Candidatus Magasanikiibacteriota TaxID=1752731 RepID=A0A1F6NJ21_9BACT|nr:MAG: hypothetical protein A2224_03455 [Candidatus Magasanikbacteria bacterium RIFOXYA2_FULL_40_20]OGH83828.1 MAG: hypothetical protein A2373_00285 [Candidatus Magasanikbacteria bacterium RIFOXYB1_FULL_40_15]OGH87728.1 MAG: hypothetical protein A2206_01535 [Candidatus Magasanikbacteria bacterium RIFOXYA1_FULL_40_8]